MASCSSGTTARGCLIGELHGAITALLLRINADPHVIFAGERDSERTDHVEIRLSYGLQTCRIKNDVWMSFPEPYVPNVIVTATWRDANRNELWHWESPPLRPGEPQSYHGPGWTSHAPLDE
jgi:hypothetical protein